MRIFTQKSITCLFLILILVFAVRSNRRMVRTIRKESVEFASFENFVKYVQEHYPEVLPMEDSLIELNALFVKYAGIDTLNQVIAYKNGMLGQLKKPVEVEPFAEKAVAFSELLKKHQIPFLYIQAPDKLDLKNEILRPGCHHASNDDADRFLNILKEHGVDTFDTRPFLVATKKDVEKHFFRTDHHWNDAGSFLAYRHIARELLTRLGEPVDCLPIRKDQWTIHTHKQMFLGSLGRRTSRFYCGLDDYSYRTPKFETKMSCEIPSRGEWHTGDFSDAIVRKEMLKDRKLPYSIGAYSTLVGWDAALVRHKNELPYSRKRIVIIKDSFALPIQAYLSTIFASIDVIDLRHAKDRELVQMLTEERPDIVIQLLCPRTFTPQMFDYDVHAMDLSALNTSQQKKTP